MMMFRVVRSVGLLLSIFCVAGWAQKGSPRVVHLGVKEQVPVQSFPGVSFASPVFCTSSGELLVRPDTVEALLDPLLISSDGRITAHFGRENIPQFQHSDVLYQFSREHDVFLLIDGTTPLEHQITLQTPDGKTLHQQAVEHGARLAHFDTDGTFKGSFAVDLPFQVSRFGEFANGDFLMAGTDLRNSEPRFALVNSTGQMIREIKPEADDAERKPVLPYLEMEIVADGPNLLAYMPKSNTTVFVTAGGEVRTLRLQLPDGSKLDAVQPNGNELVMEAAQYSEGGAGEKFAGYALDRNSGALRTRYEYPEELGFGMACTDGTEFTFLALDQEKHGVKLVKLGPAKDAP